MWRTRACTDTNGGGGGGGGLKSDASKMYACFDTKLEKLIYVIIISRCRYKNSLRKFSK